MTLNLYCAPLYVSKGKFSSSPPDFFDWISGCRYQTLPSFSVHFGVGPRRAGSIDKFSSNGCIKDLVGFL